MSRSSFPYDATHRDDSDLPLSSDEEELEQRLLAATSTGGTAREKRENSLQANNNSVSSVQYLLGQKELPISQSSTSRAVHIKKVTSSSSGGSSSHKKSINRRKLIDEDDDDDSLQPGAQSWFARHRCLLIFILLLLLVLSVMLFVNVQYHIGPNLTGWMGKKESASAPEHNAILATTTTKHHDSTLNSRMRQRQQQQQQVHQQQQQQKHRPSAPQFRSREYGLPTTDETENELYQQPSTNHIISSIGEDPMPLTPSSPHLPSSSLTPAQLRAELAQLSRVLDHMHSHSDHVDPSLSDPSSPQSKSSSSPSSSSSMHFEDLPDLSADLASLPQLPSFPSDDVSSHTPTPLQHEDPFSVHDLEKELGMTPEEEVERRVEEERRRLGLPTSVKKGRTTGSYVDGIADLAADEDEEEEDDDQDDSHEYDNDIASPLPPLPSIDPIMDLPQMVDEVRGEKKQKDSGSIKQPLPPLAASPAIGMNNKAQAAASLPQPSPPLPVVPTSTASTPTAASQSVFLELPSSASLSPATLPPIFCPPPFCTPLQHCSAVNNLISFHSADLGAVDKEEKMQGLEESVVRFMRGTTAVFWWQMMPPAKTSAQASSSSPPSSSSAALDLLHTRYTSPHARCFINGDLHLLNLGIFHDSLYSYDVETNETQLLSDEIIGGNDPRAPRVRYDMNDFDHAFVSMYYWTDLVRVMTSLVMSMIDEQQQQRFTQEDIESVLQAFPHSYHNSVLSFVDNTNELSYIITRSTLPRKSPLAKRLKKIAKKDSRIGLLEKFTVIDEDTGLRKFDLADDRFEVVTKEEEEEIKSRWPEYVKSLGQHRRHSSFLSPPSRTPPLHLPSSFYTIKSLAHRLGSGLGSRGVRRYYILVEGMTDEQDDDVILDVKEEREPEWTRFVKEENEKMEYGSSAQRVVMAMNAFAPVFLVVVNSQENGGFVSALDTTADEDPAVTSLQQFMTSEPHVGVLELSSIASPSSTTSAAARSAFLIRERSPWKAEFDVASSLSSLSEYTAFSTLLGTLLAASHSRSDNDYDPSLISTSFESEFVKILPTSDERRIWSNALIQLTMEQVKQRRMDYECFVNERKRKKKKKNS